ncbi:MAG: OmpA family protein [Bacteroidales bacterium]|nr:OmpA family protein [Bacteroidales bacterium]
MGKNSIFTALFLPIMLFFVLIMSPEMTFGQTYHTTSKKAINLYKKGKSAYIKKDYEKSLKLIEKSLNCDNDFVEALQIRGGIGIALDDIKMAANSYERSLAADSTAFPWNAVVLANLYMESADYEDAIKVLKWYSKLNNQKEEKLKIARKLLANAEFRNFAVNNPVDFEPVNVGENVNTDGDEYINQIAPDGGRIYFTRRLQEKDENGYRIEGVYYSSIVGSDYVTAIPMDLDWNNNKRIGAVNISADQKKMFFVGFDWLDSKGRGDIYMSLYEDTNWGKPVNLGNVVNTSTVESQPCLSPDGTELYFTRYSRTYESTDIYVSTCFKGEWSNPQSLTNINSTGNEMAPFLHPDGKTLYFASDGFPGMGGYDIFMSRRNEKGEWSEPVNLGYPLNTEGDEMTFAVSTDGTTGYISSIRENGFGGYDIYVFNLDPEVAPETVADEQRFVLHNIKFELDSDVLDSVSYKEIASVAAYLSENQNVKVEIAGFTDNSGSKEHNLDLSLRRAESVKKALVGMEIEENRISTKGYGENRPVAPNDNEEGRALNRRVEMRIL